MGKLLVILGVILIVVGLGWHFGIRIPHLGNLPGDIHIQRENFSFYFPLTTCILISILIMGAMYLVRWFNGN